MDSFLVKNSFGYRSVVSVFCLVLSASVTNAMATNYLDIAIDPYAQLRQQRNLIEEDEAKPFYVDALSVHNVSYDITAETTGLVGEQIDQGTGAISFAQTDISIPGNSKLPVEVRRVFNDANFKQNATAEFSDWSLDLPSIHTTLMYAETQSAGSWGKGLECSGGQEPGPIEHKTGPIMAKSYWNGTVLLVNGGQQHLLQVGLPDKAYTTKSHWKFTCYKRADGKGEGFRGVDPNGIIYKFDTPHAVQSFASSDRQISKPYHVYLRVSSMEDPYGNWVKFNYTAYKNANQKTSQRLDSIQSNDGRLITFTYHTTAGQQHLVKQITANGQSWEYQYTNDRMPTLAKTILPADPNNPGQLSFWQYDLQQLNLWHNDTLIAEYQDMQSSCQKRPAFTRGSIKHPEGALAEFELEPVIHGRTRVFISFDFSDVGRNSLCYITQAVKRKTLSGPGLDKMVWDYSYSENAGAYEGYSGAVPAAVTVEGYDSIDLKTTTIAAPDGSKTINVFYRGWFYLEGQQVSTIFLDTDGVTELQRQWSAFSVRQLYLGSPLIGSDYSANAESLSAPALEKETTIRLTGGGNQRYLTRYLNYNAFDKAEQWKETNSLGVAERTTNVSYQQDLTNWILNLETNRQVTIGNESISSKSATYYPADSAAKSLLKTESLYGQLRKSHEYHPDGNLRKTTYALNNRWVHFDQYKRGKPQHIRFPNRYDAGNFLVELQVNDTGTIAAAKDLNGNQTRYGYDVRNRVTLIDPVDPKWADTTVKYETDQSGNYALLQHVSKGAYRKTIKLDAVLQPSISKEWDFNNEAATVRYINRQFNAYGKAVFTSVPSQNSAEHYGSSTSFDGLQRLIAETNTANGDLSYLYNADNSVIIKNGRNHQTTTHYLAYGTPEQKLATAIHQPEAVLTQISYNIAGLPTTILQGGVTEQRFYNSRMQLCLLKRPETGIKVMQYNLLGQVEKYAEGLSGNGSHCTDFNQNAAAWITVTYDNLGDQQGIIYADGQTPTLSYGLDNQANLKTLTAGSVSWSYDYNSQNLLEKETLIVDGKNYLIDQDYDALGSLKSLTVAGSTIDYAPNALGQPGKVTENNQNYATAVLFHPNQQLKSFTYGNGLLFSQSLDGDHRPYERVAKLGGSSKVAQRYTYDLNNNVESIHNLIDSSKTVRLSYDDLDRLETASGYWGSGNFVYDGLGNIKNKNLGSQQLTFSYDTTKNRLQSVTGGYNFGYDDRGNVTNNGKRTFTVNRANQITTSGNLTYQYDGHGRRVKKSGSTTSYSVYNQAGQLLLTDGPQGVTRYIYLGKELIAKTGSSAALEDKPGYTGHLEDRDIGLTYMQQRYYDPVIGRFYSNDPVDMQGHIQKGNPTMGFNRYAYANNNPYKYTDPDGEIVQAVLGAIVGAVAEAASQAIAGKGFDGEKIAASALIGGITGGASTVASGMGKIAVFATEASMGAVGSAGESLIHDAIDGKTGDLGKALTSAAASVPGLGNSGTMQKLVGDTVKGAMKNTGANEVNKSLVSGAAGAVTSSTVKAAENWATKTEPVDEKK